MAQPRGGDHWGRAGQRAAWRSPPARHNQLRLDTATTIGGRIRRGSRQSVRHNVRWAADVAYFSQKLSYKRQLPPLPVGARVRHTTNGAHQRQMIRKNNKTPPLEKVAKMQNA
jgi:hypothetical protein